LHHDAAAPKAADANNNGTANDTNITNDTNNGHAPYDKTTDDND